jgi:LysM repeat protein
VQRGETLSGLAKQYGVSVQALRIANNLTGRAPLKAGRAIRIPN